MTDAPPPARFVVLAAVDDSEAAHGVVGAAANLARTSAGGELHLVHVIEDMPPPVAVVPRPAGLGITAWELETAASRRLGAQAIEAREEFKGRIVTHLAAGVAWKQILQVATDLQADVIVLSTHGRSGIKRAVIGSVAETVVRKASCPVVVVRDKDYHGLLPPEIEPPCPACVATQRESGGSRLWCDRHSQHHPRPHTYHELPEGFGAGSQLLRPIG
jgi:nucleotide-binding universal stress UspA family protein